MKSYFTSRAISTPLIFTVIVSALLTSACSIKPPDDDSALGPEISASDINNAKADARAGYTFAQAFHTGDAGVVQIVDNVMGNKSIRDANQLSVTGVSQGTALITETDTTTGSIINGQIADSDWAATQSSLTSHLLKFFAVFPQPLSYSLSENLLKASRFVASLRVERSQAMGETLGVPVTVKSFTGVLENRLRQNLALLMTGGLSKKDLGTGTPAPSPTATPVASATPVPSAAPTPDPSSDTTSHYYNLQILKHQFMTSNCSQIPNCEVTSTRLDYIEIRTVTASDQSTQNARVHWSLEISTDVPGLFVFMEQCYSTLVNQNNQQIPLTECVHVDSFNFGAGS